MMSFLSLPLIGPRLVNWPIEDSKKKNGKPKINRLAMYGIKNEPPPFL